jgi:hypothetical protein
LAGVRRLDDIADVCQLVALRVERHDIDRFIISS